MSISLPAHEVQEIKHSHMEREGLFEFLPGFRIGCLRERRHIWKEIGLGGSERHGGGEEVLALAFLRCYEFIFEPADGGSFEGFIRTVLKSVYDEG